MTQEVEIDSVSDNEITLLSYLANPVDAGAILEIVTWNASSPYIAMDDMSGWKFGMNIEVSLDDGSFVEQKVTRIYDTGYMLLFGVLGVDTRHGALVKRRLGADGVDDIDMSAGTFGTWPTTVAATIPGDPAWGLRATIPHDHPDLQPGMRVRGEISLIDTVPNPDLYLTRKVVGTVINE